MTNFTEEWLLDYQAKLHGTSSVPAKPDIPPPETRIISLALSVPPSVNHAFANVPGIGRVKSAKYRAWRKVARSEAQIGMAGKSAIKAPFKATIHVAARGDLDNRVKGVMDFCQTIGAIKNDSGLVELHVYRQSGTPGVWITIEAVDSTDVRSVASP